MSFVRCGVFFWYWETTLRMVCWSTSGTDFGLLGFVENALLVVEVVVAVTGAVVVVVVVAVWTGTAMLAGLGALAGFFGAIDAYCLGLCDDIAQREREVNSGLLLLVVRLVCAAMDVA